MTIQSSDIYNNPKPLESPYSIIWCDDDPIDPSEVYSTSTARIMPPKQVSKPFYIRLEDLESIQEISEIKEQHSER